MDDGDITAKLIGIEIGDLIASGPAANWPEMDQMIWLCIHDDNTLLGLDEGWADRIVLALSVLNKFESGDWKVAE